MFPNDDSEKIGKKRSIFEEFLREIEPIQRMKREKRSERKIYERFSCYVKPYGDATF